MDLSNWNTTDKAEAGSRMYIRDLTTGEKTELYIDLKGEDSARYREKKSELDRRRLKESMQADGTGRSFEEDEIELLSVLPTGWYLVENGKELELSEKEAARVFREYPRIRKQANNFVHSARHFLPDSRSD